MLKRETEGLCPAARSFCLQGILGEEAEGSEWEKSSMATASRVSDGQKRGTNNGEREREREVVWGTN